jgi:hypothetical protein
VLRNRAGNSKLYKPLDRFLYRAAKAVPYVQVVILGCIKSSGRPLVVAWLPRRRDKLSNNRVAARPGCHTTAVVHMQPCISLQHIKVEQTRVKSAEIWGFNTLLVRISTVQNFQFIPSKKINIYNFSIGSSLAPSLGRSHSRTCAVNQRLA